MCPNSRSYNYTRFERFRLLFGVFLRSQDSQDEGISFGNSHTMFKMRC